MSSWFLQKVINSIEGGLTYFSCILTIIFINEGRERDEDRMDQLWSERQVCIFRKYPILLPI